MRIKSVQTVTELIQLSLDGDKAAEGALYDMVYADLHQIAQRHLRAHFPARMQTTSLVNETYLRLAQAQTLSIRDRAHLLATASKVMHQIVISHARAACAQKRGGADQPISLDAQLHQPDEQENYQSVLALDDALTQLAKLSPRMAELVQLRFFGGLELTEIAPILGVTDRTLKRDWRTARAFLYDVLKDHAPAI
jgi:RNA polymerase sigma factor (TIGR02999 family)